MATTTSNPHRTLAPEAFVIRLTGDMVPASGGRYPEAGDTRCFEVYPNLGAVAGHPWFVCEPSRNPRIGTMGRQSWDLADAMRLPTAEAAQEELDRQVGLNLVHPTVARHAVIEGVRRHRGRWVRLV